MTTSNRRRFITGVVERPPFDWVESPGELVDRLGTLGGLTIRVDTVTVELDRLPEIDLTLEVLEGKPVTAPAVLPGMDGPICIHCGGMTKRAGTCAVCTDCGETTGCG